jgi:hypothetical protein
MLPTPNLFQNLQGNWRNIADNGKGACGSHVCLMSACHPCSSKLHAAELMINSSEHKAFIAHYAPIV